MFTEFKSLFDLLAAFPNEQACIEHLEHMRWEGVIESPFDPTSTVYKCKNNRYKCRNTNKYFNAKTGTIFDDSKIPLLKWYMALYLFSSHKKGISSHQLSKDISVTQKSAWYMLHRLRYAFDHPKFQDTLKDVVEVDETFVGGQAINKHASKKIKTAGGGTKHEKQPVFGMKQRGGHVIARVVENRHKETLLPIIYQHIEGESTIMSDEYTGYKDLRFDYTHYRVNHGAKEYVNQMAHTNGIENFWSHMKRGIDGIYHWVSVKHLQPYVTEYALRYNTRKMTTCNRFDLILGNVNGKKLPYKTLIGKA